MFPTGLPIVCCTFINKNLTESNIDSSIQRLYSVLAPIQLDLRTDRPCTSSPALSGPMRTSVDISGHFYISVWFDSGQDSGQEMNHDWLF